MKIYTHTHTRERGLMLRRNCWSTLATALVASLALLLVQPSGAAAGTITFLDGTDTLTVSLSADIVARGGSSSSCSGEVCSVTLNGPTGQTAAVSTGNVNIFGLEFEPPTFARALSTTVLETISPSLANVRTSGTGGVATAREPGARTPWRSRWGHGVQVAPAAPRGVKPLGRRAGRRKARGAGGESLARSAARYAYAAIHNAP